MSEAAHSGVVPAAVRDTPPPERPKTQVLNAPLPEGVYWHVRAMAIQSRLPVKVYLARLLAEAWPYPPPDEETATEQHQVPATGPG
jgi:hypothetical protein